MASLFASSLSPTERLVAALVGQQSRSQLASADLAGCDLSEFGKLFRIAEANEVTSHVGHALRERGIDLPAAWHEVHQQTERRIARYMAELDAIAKALKAKNIPLVALKNAGIARALHDCLGCCPMGDLDALVRRQDFREAHQVLVKLGYQFEFRSPLERAEIDEAELGGGSEYWKQLDDGSRLWFELQWRPIAGRWLRPDQEPSAEELMARSIDVPQTDVKLLSPTDNLLQVAVHTAKHSYVRAPGFRLHTDVDRIVNAQEIDWDMFMADVKRRELKTAVYFSLRIPAELFATPIPTDVIAELSPPAWKTSQLNRQLLKAGLLYPDRPKFSRVGYIGFNALLYDSWSGLWRGLFPAAAWMRQRYQAEGFWLYPAYFQRIVGLACRRTKT